MRAVLVFCEGRHDVEFIKRSLGRAGGEWVGQQIKDLPFPFGPKSDPLQPNQLISAGIVMTRVRRSALEQLENKQLHVVAHSTTPTFEALLRNIDDQTYYLLVRLGGDSDREAAVDMVRGIASLMQMHENLDSEITALGHAFVFDANSRGVDAREQRFMAAYTDLLADQRIGHGRWVHGAYGPMGLYVFHDSDSRTGTLEDIVAPMVQEQWPQRWDAAGSYLSAYAEADEPVELTPTKRLKAQVTIAGQFRCPGEPMSRIVGRDGLAGECFDRRASRDLVDFLRRAPFS